ncbi:hypothetical protein BK675_11405 [Pseudomonas fluorescens]|jgi:hypothetical protein|nr:hypothetical protein DMX04_05310 [Pseudomonas koreensis]RON75909.1 hypothetical protein BK677_02055 [Pseudomonas fluorescens]RRW51900.1 hypothetical protein EGJ55_23500 [Pseudomonas moraviensis]ROO08580.1 hypothetical protein BK675_11405 [Pseudomonas fluorescens]ROO16722.1 hypothetical protein BK676_13760 [Pseudomonas fluorescens]
MAFIKDYSHAREWSFSNAGQYRRAVQRLIQLRCALSSGRIVITMMATSKHLIKQQDELFIAVCRRSPYMSQGFP